MKQIGFGGGCHWCTEAVFQSLVGVSEVTQGFIAPEGQGDDFSEAVVVGYDTDQIDLRTLIEIHLLTHNSTKNHSMREKYRSAVYVYDTKTFNIALAILQDLQKDFTEPLITRVFYFGQYKYSEEQFHNYYYSNPQKPFCERYISPKLALLQKRFSKVMIDNTQ
ncbi:peptide-methionine (S)-S-oxide reductase [uncultured Croceitalea sp.]|uniref:peptide-methionine (S)-S-oxide reductase n=1 Tax=uncultured Croceitalea sp. TaxID=1798908 RepID=UPI003305A829